MKKFVLLFLLFTAVLYPQSTNRVGLLTRADFVSMKSDEQVEYVRGVSDILLIIDTKTDSFSKDHLFLKCSTEPQSPFANPMMLGKAVALVITGDKMHSPSEPQSSPVATDIFATLSTVCGGNKTDQR